jgi:ATP-dependent Lon protease
MEIVRLAGYTPEEKTEIARAYLIPRQTEEAGLPVDRIHWSEPALGRLVTEYTAEAGVRNLERQVATVCRKVARRAAEGDESPVKLTRRNLSGYLGPAPYVQEASAEEGQIGVATGLAWTESGGDVLSIEAAMTRGKGLVLTGQLGDVMKESGHAALTWVRSGASALGIEEKVLIEHEIHVHVPAGAIPKDGPSAGVTMATAIASLAIGVAIRPDVAMTGEVTLSGRVLPVGGVREKALAALRHGIHTVILPRKNLDDLEEVPREVKRKMTFVPVTHMSEVLAVALEAAPPPKRRRRTPSTPTAQAQAKKP